MGEVGEKVKAELEIRSLKRGDKFTLDNLEPGWSDLLIEDFVFENEALLSAKAIPVREGERVYAVEFNLTTDPEEKHRTPNQPIQGIIGEALIIVSDNPSQPKDRYRVSVGKPDTRGDERTVLFDQWHPLPTLVKKTEIMRMLKQGQLRQSQPLTETKDNLKSVRFITL